jgi:hypothetical protein
MSTTALSQLFLLYTWFALAAVLFFLLLIARFYQKFSGERTYFRLFLMPMLLFGVAAVRYSSIDRVAHDAFGDIFMTVAGLVLAWLCIRLYRRMTAGRGVP